MWETAKQFVKGPAEFEGTFVVPRPILDAIKSHAAEHPDRETGGMLFGRIDETEESLDIVVEVVHNVSENKASNTSTYFGIEPDYATEILHEYEPNHLYLGNWHSHLGYGGPSSGDRQEVEKFFVENEARDVTLDFIMDRQSETKLVYKPIIDVYRRKGDHMSEYRILRVGHGCLEIPEMDKESVIITNSMEFDTDENHVKPAKSAGVDDERTNELTTFLCKTYEINHEDIKTYRNEPLNETVTLAPFSYEQEQKGSTIDVMLKVSVPDDDSDEVFVDLTSPTLEKQLTISKISADAIDDSRSVLTDHVVRALEEKIPMLLDQSLSKVISGIDDDETVTNTRWQLCQN